RPSPAPVPYTTPFRSRGPRPFPDKGQHRPPRAQEGVADAGSRVDPAAKGIDLDQDRVGSGAGCGCHRPLHEGGQPLIDGPGDRDDDHLGRRRLAKPAAPVDAQEQAQHQAQPTAYAHGPSPVPRSGPATGSLPRPPPPTGWGGTWRKKGRPFRPPPPRPVARLSLAALACGGRLLLPPHAGLVVVFPFAQLRLDAFPAAELLEPAQGLVQALVLPDAHFGHGSGLPPLWRQMCTPGLYANRPRGLPPRRWKCR